MSYDLVVRGKRIMTTAGEQPREIGVSGGRIVAIEPLGNALDGDRVIELADDEVLLPGLVDTHVHVNEPGRTEWEGFASATRAAASGGVTTIVDMPLNSIPPTVDVGALEVKRKVAADQAAKEKAASANPFGTPGGQETDYEQAAAALDLPQDFAKFLK